MHKAHRLYYGAYEYRGHRIEKATNPNCYPCLRWGVWDGPAGHKTAFTFAGAKRLIDAYWAAKGEGE